MASVPFLRRQRDATALGGQQAQRLRTLRLASERHVQEQHLQLSRGIGESLQPALADDHATALPHSSRASRTVEAVIESRLADDSVPSKAVKLRETIRDARGGIQTERSARERPRPTAALPDLTSATTALRPATHTAALTRTIGIRQKIAAVRRRPPTVAASKATRKLTHEELEWIEKQLQYKQRIGLVEKECAAWWRNFYASAGASYGEETGTTTTLSIQKHLEGCDQRRVQDTEHMLQQLNALRSQADDVMHMVHAMRDGTQFAMDLQDAMDGFETVLGAFRTAQREKFDAYVVEEKLLDRDLAAFMEKIEAWEQEEVEKKTHKPTIKSLKRSGALAKTTEAMASRSRGDAAAVFEGNTDALDADSSEQTALVDEDGRDKNEPTNVKAEFDLVKHVRHLNNQILPSGGLKGGWDDREHAVFASMLLKCGLTDGVIMANQVVTNGGSKNQEIGAGGSDFEATVARFLRKCIKAVITKSEYAVRNHFDWYIGHLQLLQEKKEAIEQWKQNKEQEREQLIRQGLHQVELDQEKGQHEYEANPGSVPRESREMAEERARRKELEVKDRVRTNQQLEVWREEKERRITEKLEQEKNEKMQREARAAKKRQELLEKKQQILLYRLQKEEESTLLQRNRAPKAQGSHSPSGANEEFLLERSRKAIETAKAKRAHLLAMEERRQKQQELPERPKSVTKQKPPSAGSAANSPTDSEGSPSTRETTLLKPTKVYEARQLTKLELKRKEKERSRQGAHDAYFPGANVVSDVKIKSFGHIAIAPRAVPTWRRNI